MPKSLSSGITRLEVADDLIRDGLDEVPVHLRVAADYAYALSAKLDFVHAYRVPEFMEATDVLTRLEIPYTQKADDVIRSFALETQKARPGLTGLINIEKGKPVDVILHHAAEFGCQILVLGVHAHRALTRAVIGSVTEEIIQRSPIPVLTVNPHLELKSSYVPSKILVPVDLPNSVSSPLLARAVQMAKAFSAELTLVHVLEEWVYPVVQSASLMAGGFVMPLERNLEELANKRYAELDGLAQQMRFSSSDREEPLSVSVKLVERASSVGAAIVETAAQESFDLILIGHHQVSKLELAVLGSVSRSVIREATCPVLTASFK